MTSMEEGNWQHCPLKGDTNAYENWADEEPNDYNGGEDCGVQDQEEAVVHGTMTTVKTLTLPYASSLLAVVAASLLSACYTTPWRSSWVKASDHAGRLAVHIPDVTPSICLNKLEGRWFACRATLKLWFINTPDSFSTPIGGERVTWGCLNGW